jgi:hypothetical protein
MSLDRKDVRAKLDPDLHAALKAICEIDNADMGEWIEAQLVPVIRKRMHDATVLAAELQRLGITWNGRESPGAGGK